jgi:RecA/RadA recombinase
MARVKKVKEESAEVEQSPRDSAIGAVNAALRYRASAKEDDVLLSTPRWCIPTGITLLDNSIGGGMLEGKLCRFHGDEGTSKSTLAFTAMLQAMDRGAYCVYADLESSFDKVRVEQLAAVLGIKPRWDLFIPIEALHLDDLFKSIFVVLNDLHPTTDQYSKRPEFTEPLVIFIDTISVCPTKGEYEAVRALRPSRKKAKVGVGAKAGPGGKEKKTEGMMSRARYIKQAMRQMSMTLPKHGAALVVIEQSIAQIQQRGRPGGKTTSGGKGIPYQSSQSFMMSPRSLISIDRITVGRNVGFTTEKTRFRKPRAKFIVPYYFERGFNDAESMVLYLLGQGLITKHAPEKRGMPESYSIALEDQVFRFTRPELQEGQLPVEAVKLLRTVVAANLDGLWMAPVEEE